MAKPRRQVSTNIAQQKVAPHEIKSVEKVLQLPPAHSPQQERLIYAWELRYDPVKDPLCKEPFYDPTRSNWDVLPVAYPDLRILVGAAGTKLGKCLKTTELIPTTQGWKTLADVREGDFVFDETGNPTKVTFATDPMYNHVCYDVEFSDGSVVTADADHLWVTSTWADRKSAGRTKSGFLRSAARTTEEIRLTLLACYSNRQRPNHSIPVVSAPLQYPEQDLPLSPYVLGYWLANGHAASGVITLMMHKSWRSLAKRVSHPICLCHKYVSGE